jgi:large subunit ribosomal protein L21
MFAIVTIAGQQFKVEEGQKIFVHRLDAQVGDKVSFDQVLLTDHNGSVNVGNPTVLSHAKGNKEIVFKKKRRKGYRVKNGHRQQFTQVEIKSIVAGSPVTIELGKKAVAAKPFVAPKPAAVKVEAPKVEAPSVVEAPKASKAKGDDLTIVVFLLLVNLQHSQKKLSERFLLHTEVHIQR